MEKTFTITLNKDGGFRFAKNGEILCGIAKVGTWRKRNIWKENGGRRDKSGQKLVPVIYEAHLNDGTNLCEYSRKELANALHGRKIQTVVDVK